MKWSELWWSSWGQKYHVHWSDLILRVLDCIVTISFMCILYCGCFNLFCNVWVCVRVGVLVICVFSVLAIVCTVFFVLFHLYIFILICFVCTIVRTTATKWQLNCSSSSNNNNFKEAFSFDDLVQDTNCLLNNISLAFLWCWSLLYIIFSRTQKNEVGYDIGL